MNDKLSLDTLNRRIESLEKALQLREKEAVAYRSLFDDAINAALIINLQTGHIVNANQSAIKMFGFTRDELLQIEFFSLGKDDPPFKWGDQNTIEALKIQKSLEYEWLAGKKNGTSFYTRLIFKKYVFDDKPLVLAIVRDISLSKKQEAALYANEIRYKTIIQTASIGFLLISRQGKILDTNDTYCKMSGYSRDELLSMHFTDLDLALTPESAATKIDVAALKSSKKTFISKRYMPVKAQAVAVLSLPLIPSRPNTTNTFVKGTLNGSKLNLRP